MADTTKTLVRAELRELADAVAQPRIEHVNGDPFVLLPPGWEAKQHKDLRSSPQRIARDVTFTDVESFVEYVNRFKDDGSIIFVDGSPNGVSMEAVLDYDKPGDPRHGSHRARFVATQTEAAKAWFGQNGKKIAQSEFIQFIYKHRRNVASPSGATLLEVLSDLKLTVKGEFRDVVDDLTGSRQLVYQVDVRGQSMKRDQTINLPRSMDVAFVPFIGFPAVTFTADLKIEPPRDTDERPLFGFDFDQLQDTMLGSVNDITQTVRLRTALPTLAYKRER